MAEQKVDNIMIAPENVELQSGDTTQNSGAMAPSEEAAGEIFNDEEKMVPEVGNEENSDGLAEETISDPVKQEDGDLEKDSDIPEGTIRNVSPLEETDVADGQTKRTPTVVIVGSNHKFPVQSRYLSASMGSCHDLCKFGHKHEETKIKRPMLGRIREGRPIVKTTSDDLAASVLNKETKKKELFRRLSLPGTIAEKDPPKHTENTDRSKKDINRSTLKRIQSEMKPSSVPPSRRSSIGGKTDIQAGKKLVVQSSDLPDNTSQRVKAIKTGKEPGSHSKSDKEKAKVPMNKSTSPKTPLKKSPSIKARLYKNLKSFPRSKIQINSEEAKSNVPNDVPEKTLYMIEPNTDKKPARKASKVAPSNKSSPNTPWGSNVTKRKGSKISQKGKPSSSSSAAVFTASATQEPSQPKGENQQDSDSISTKEIGTVKPDGGSKPSTPRAKSTVDRKMNTKKTGTSHTEEEDSSAWKVKFKRGTVVALQVANGGPKKLLFKSRRNLGDHQNAKDETPRSLKTKEVTAHKPHDTKPETGKVLLRHQEASEKKDNVDLNNVIEETASKLVKTRKSKVKALVGAFETVMSLPHRKPMVDTGAS